MRTFTLALVLALVLFVAFPAFSSFELEPVAPTDESPVVLQVREVWLNVCVPGNPEVTRTGNRIDVRWTVRHEPGCFARHTFWSADVPLGVLAAGEYEIVVTAERTFAPVTLVVTDATPSLIIQPRVLSSVTATEARIDAPGSCLSDDPVVLVDGSTVPSRVEGCGVIATFRPHATGAADVTVRAGGQERTTVAAVQYIDPGATPDPSLFERVLIPVLYDGPGAFGSQWATEVVMVNRTPRTLEWLPRVSQSLPPVPFDATVLLENVGNHLTGLVLFLPRGYDVRFGAVFRDLSRDSSQWGTELPIVREREFQSTVVLPNVPFDARYRLQLRIYGIQGHTFLARVSAGDLTREVEVTGTCAVRDQPCNSDEPAFGSLDLGQVFAPLAGRQRIEISAAPFDFTRRIWGMVSVTNNDTQQVTTIAPQ